MYRNTKINIKTSHNKERKKRKVNDGLRQGCSISSILFNMYSYTDDATEQWRSVTPRRDNKPTFQNAMTMFTSFILDDQL